MASQAGPRAISEERVLAKTGRTSAEWDAILDAFDVAAHGHTAAARHLREAHGLDGWWAQSVTVRYEWARGLRRELTTPDDLAAALAAHPAARARFAALPASHRREYLEWIEEAKRPATRARRVAGTVERLSVGNADALSTAIRPVAERVIAEAGLPGMIVAVAHGEAAPELLVLGSDAAGVPLTADALLPVASVTKLATALAALRLVATGAFALDDELARWLPQAAAARPGVTFRRLLAHTAGLPADVAPELAPYAPGLSWAVLREACLATPPVVEPGSYLRYSNLGPGLVAIVIEQLSGLSIGDAIQELVLGPLGVEGYLGSEPPRAPARIDGALGEHAGDALEPYNSAFYRGLGLPWGGMVMTAGCALALVRAFAGVPRGFLPPALCAEATRDQAGGVPGVMGGFRAWERASWGLGVEVHGGKLPQFAPRAASAASFGHSGHAGCLAWHDPARALSWFTHGLRTSDQWFRPSLLLNTTVVEAG